MPSYDEGIGRGTKEVTGRALIESQDTFFVAGGTLGRDAPSYIPRSADEHLKVALARRQYAYVLDSRQKGKSSLVARTMDALQQCGVRCVKVDLQRVGANLTTDQWYASMVRQFGRQLGIEREVFECWGELTQLGPLARWIAVLEQAVLPQTEAPVVVFVDEVDFVRALSFSTDEFFAAIRECYNRRALDHMFERLTFCLVGSATPSQLVRNIEVTPFNIGQEVILTDFTLPEVAPYASHLGMARDGQSLIERVYYWTSGHPYLTQALCRAIVERPDCLETKDVDVIVRELFLSTEARQRQPNLLDISRRILEARIPGLSTEEARGQMLNAYGQVLAGKKLIVDDSEWRFAALRLSGAVKEEAGTIVLRNRIYATVFDRSWIRANMPDAELRRQRRAALKAVVKTATVALAVTAVVALFALRASQLAAEQVVLKQQAQYDAYCAAMIAATTKWEDSDRSGIQAVLETHANDPWKGWEWGFWKKRIGGRVLEFEGILEPAIQFANQSGQLLVRSEGSLARYDIKTLTPIERYPMPPGAYWMTRELPDGRLLDAQRNGDLCCYSSEARSLLWETNIGNIEWPNGNLTDSSYRWMANETDRTLSVIDLSNGKIRKRPGFFFRPDFSKDRNSVLCGFEIATPTFPVRTVAALVLDPITLKVLHRLPVENNSRIVAVSYVRKLMAVGDADGEMEIYDLTTNKRLLGHRFPPSELWHLSFDAAGTTLLACTMDKRGVMFDVSNGQPVLLREIDGFWGFSYSPDGRNWLGRFHPPVLFEHELPQWGESPVPLTPFDTLSVPRRDNLLFIPVKERQEWRWKKVQLDAPTLSPPKIGQIPVNREVISECGMGTGRVRHVDGTEDVIDVESGSVIARNTDKDMPWRTYISFGRGKGLAISDLDGNASLIDNSGKPRLIIPFYTMPLDFSPDRKTLAVGTDQGFLYLVDTETGELSRRKISRFTLNDGEFSRDGKRIAIAHDPNSAGIFDVAKGKPIVRFKGHASNVIGIGWSPDERRIVTGGRDQTVRIWDAKTGRLLSILRGHKAPVRYVRFLPNGIHLISIDVNGNLIRWTGSTD